MSGSDYPNEPGHRGVHTSVEAADSISRSVGRLQRLVLSAIREAGAGGLTSQELADRTSIDFSAAQPRTSELRRLGLIRDSGDRRRNRNGKKAIVWIALTEAERGDLLVPVAADYARMTSASVDAAGLRRGGTA